MADTKEYKEFQKLTWKDIQDLMLVTDASAQSYLTDIKQHFNVKAATYQHFKRYFNLA